MPSVSPERHRLASRLRELRAATGLSGNRFATERIGWGQARVSRLETGTQLPTENDIHTWVDATGAGADVTAELLELLTRARMEYVAHRDSYRRSGGAVNDQVEYAHREARATQLLGYQPGMIPGLLQTAAYARELFALPCGPAAVGATETDLEGLVADRIRRQEVLYQPSKRICVIIGETALHHPPGSVATLVGQLDRLVAVAGLANVDLGVLPLRVPMPVFPLSGFWLLDDSVLIETLTGVQQLDGPDEVAVYVEAFERLRGAAVIGPLAVALIRQLMDELSG